MHGREGWVGNGELQRGYGVGRYEREVVGGDIPGTTVRRRRPEPDPERQRGEEPTQALPVRPRPEGSDRLRQPDATHWLRAPNPRRILRRFGWGKVEGSGGQGGRRPPTCTAPCTPHTGPCTVWRSVARGMAPKGCNGPPKGRDRPPSSLAKRMHRSGAPRALERVGTAQNGREPRPSALSVRTTPQRRRNGRPTWCRPSWSRGCARFSPH